MTFRVHRGFTLIEVLIAAFVLSILATGTIAATWKLAGLARMKASELTAEAFCSDVAMAYFSQDLSKLVNPSKPYFKHQFTSQTECKLFPRFRGKTLFGESTEAIPFWRQGYKNPTLTVWVTNVVNNGTQMPRVSVSLDWGVAGDADFKPATFSLDQVKPQE